LSRAAARCQRRRGNPRNRAGALRSWGGTSAPAAPAQAASEAARKGASESSATGGDPSQSASSLCGGGFASARAPRGGRRAPSRPPRTVSGPPVPLYRGRRPGPGQLPDRPSPGPAGSRFVQQSRTADLRLLSRPRRGFGSAGPRQPGRLDDPMAATDVYAHPSREFDHRSNLGPGCDRLEDMRGCVCEPRLRLGQAG
jgi:hypothetical protein